jgi:hypothetical protein
MTNEEIIRAERQLLLCTVFGEMIEKATNGIPSGHLYAMVMSKVSFEEYEACIHVLKEAKLVAENSYLLRWIGPPIPPLGIVTSA